MATRTKVLGAAIAALTASAVLLLASCTSTSTADPSGSTSVSGSSAPTSSVLSNTNTSTPNSLPAAVSSSAPVSSSAAPNPWPADLTPDQVTQAQAAITAFEGFIKLVDQAFAVPGNDWSAEAAKWATDPVKSSFLQNMAGTAALGQYGDGETVVYPMVTKVETGLVTMSVCVDSTDAGFFDKTGTSIKAPDAPGTYYRHMSEVQVALYEGGQWLVTFITDDYNTTC